MDVGCIIMCLTPHFLEIVVDVKASGPLLLLLLWLVVSNGMLTVKYFRSN